MAASGPSHVVVRCAIDEIAEFSGETEMPKYMKVFILQEIAKARQMEAMNDPDEYFDSLMDLGDSRRIGNEKPMGLNERIAKAEEEISTLEAHLEIMDAAINSE
ncbi:hypothetical protein Tco_0801882 [Tanacetum coccineum]|uniref:Uncharacterized protein n=1 Tax=Tanacetum coccineum TaxID=301880 RepID=A0ABQ4ZX91_9ASTR